MAVDLDEHYEALEQRFPPQAGGDYERLVVPTSNAEESVHRWFHMKEAYSPQLLDRVLKDLGLSGESQLRLHDPFAGSGTTLVSGLLANDGPEIVGSGTEINPYLHLLASTKTSALSLPTSARRELADEVASAAARCTAAAHQRGRPPAAPALAAFANMDYFPRAQLAQLLRIRAVWQELPRGLSKNLFAIALAGSVEGCSRLRRDGRALRYVPSKEPESAVAAIERRVARIVEDLQSVVTRGLGAVMNGTALDGATWPVDLDLACFSPPYPNNIDYTEVYKLEAWFLGLISDSLEFQQKRLVTLRSHPSIEFPDRVVAGLPVALLSVVKELSAPLLAAVPVNRYRHQRARVISGYLSDLAVVLWRCHSALAPGGSAVYVVGNSRHGSADAHYTIASDVLIAALADAVGFDVAEVKAARSLYRRGKHEHLRESVVFLRKPAACRRPRHRQA